MTRRVAPESRPAELLAAGLAQLRAKGSATTVEDVTRAAGTAKGSFYRYFDSWDDFLDAVREQTYDEWLAAAAPLDGVAGADDFWARLEGEVGRFVDFLDELGPAHVDTSPATSVGQNGGIDHFGFTLVDQNQLDAAVTAVIAAGGTLLRTDELAPGWPTAFLRDPDGYAFQL
jgi:AcrR family transcriptional regulator